MARAAPLLELWMPNYEDGAFYIVTYATTSKVIISILVLRETLTWMSVLGMALSLAGLFISEYRGRKANANK